MNLIRKFGWHLAGVTASIMVVFAMLAGGGGSPVEASHLTIDVSEAPTASGATGSVIITGFAGTLAVELSGPATFAANGAKDIVVSDNDANDEDTDSGTIELDVTATGGGTVLVDATETAGYSGDTNRETFSVGGVGGLATITVTGPASIANGGSANATVVATDAGGTRLTVPNVTVTVSNGELAQTAAGDCVTIASDASTADNDTSCLIDTNTSTTAPAQVGVYEDGDAGETITVTAFDVSGATPVVGQLEITIAGVPAVATITAPDSVAVGASETITVDVVDASGNPVAPTTVTVAVSEGVVSCGTNMTTNGSLECTFVAPGEPASVVVTAIVDAATDIVVTDTITVGAGVTPTPTPDPGTGGDAQFDRPISNIGVNTAVWGGGTVNQLSAATAAAGGISVTVFVGGEAKVLIPGAPAFVNAEFNAAFPGGNVPEGTIVLVVR